MATHEGRSQILKEYATNLEQADKLQDLVIEAGETRTLTYRSRQLKTHYHVLEPRDVDQLKDLIGTPDMAFKERPGAAVRPTFARVVRPLVPGVVPAPAGFVSALPARVINPDVLVKPGTPEAERLEALAFARSAAEEFVFMNSAEVANWKPLVSRFLELNIPKIFAAFFKNIIVNDGATLNVARNTLVIYANRIRLYGTGGIACEGPTTFDCASLEGSL